MTCDVCVGQGARLYVQDDINVALCEPCRLALQETWDALTPEQQAKELAALAEDRHDPS